VVFPENRRYSRLGGTTHWTRSQPQKDEPYAKNLFPINFAISLRTHLASHQNPESASSMRATSASVTSLCLTVGISLFALYGQEAPKPPTSVWDGVYTVEQANRGHALYNDKCFGCHAADLGGDEDVPPIAGPEFLAKWKDHTVGELLDKIQKTMPSGKPGTLSPDVNRDILAYMLSVNAFPAGKSDLPQESDKLAQIRIDAAKPAAQ
jgi:mono/diheme cytochrome c family protein